jgi:RNA polymerase sigma factor (sigma-70 family)
MDRSDAELVAAASGGDSAAFGELSGRYERRLRQMARTVLGDPAEAEDVAQDAILAAYIDLGRLRDPERFGSWLYGIGLNLARMRVRARPPRTRVPHDGLARESTDPTPEQALEAAELLALVRAALDVLPPAQRDVVLLHYYEGLTCEEIAAVLGRSTGAVRVRLHRARGRLRDQLSTVRPKEVPTMVEMTFEDVISRTGGDDAPTEYPLRVVLLREREGSRVLPIWIGAPEGDSLALHLGGESLPRPLTSDLTARLLEAAGARVDRVEINRLSEKTFYATVRLGDSEVDARPSDALNLAARVGAPILVAESVLDEAALPGDALSDEIEAAEQALSLPVPAGTSWTPLSAESVKEAWLARAPK